MRIFLGDAVVFMCDFPNADLHEAKLSSVNAELRKKSVIPGRGASVV